MRSLIALAAAFVAVVVITLASPGGVAYATFHCMRIHAVMAGFNGNSNIQYVELRMDIGGQNFLATKTIEFREASGALRATFTFPPGTFPLGASTANASTGDSILIATQDFNNVAVGGSADFVFSGANTTGTNPLHPVPGPGGKVTFAPGFSNCALTTPVDSVAYGSVSGLASANYGTAAMALPNPSDNRALRLNNLNTNPTNNSTEYAAPVGGLQPVATTTFAVAPANLATDFTTPRNNGRTVLKLTAPSVGGVAEEPQPAVTGSAAAGGGGGGMGYAPYVAAAALAGALAAGGAWRVRRRHRRT